MNNPSYIAINQDELFDHSPKEIRELIEGGEVNNTTAVLGKIYKLPVSSYIALSNIITFLLIGAILPENAVRALIELVKVSEDDAHKIAEDLERGIFEKARISILRKSPKDMVELTFQEGRTPDELRKEILDTTKRESGFVKEQVSSLPPPSSPLPLPQGEAPVPPPAQPIPLPVQTPKKFEVAPGSRSQLLEQLQVLDAIPNDEEITDRLSKIQAQIASMEAKDTTDLETKVPLQQFMFGEKGGETVEPELKSATYSKAPTKYNVDPYREISEEG